MKHLKLLFTALLLLYGSVTSAYDFEVDGICYRITDTINNTVEITYKGEILEYYNDQVHSLVIPEKVAYNGVTYSVTGIGVWAFNSYVTLSEITIPSSVTYIGERAFFNCVALTSIDIPSSVTYIGGDAFDNTLWLDSKPDGIIYIGEILYCYKGEMSENFWINVKDGTSSIASNAFSNCNNLAGISIPQSVIDIGYGAFTGCSGLTSIKIPNRVTSIENDAFSDCTNLTSIEIPAGVTSIGSEAFSGCTGLTSIEIPAGVTSVENDAFSGCTNLTSIEIPGSVTSIEYGAFSGCTNLASIEIPGSVTSIGSYAFSGCTNLASFGIPAGVTSIGHNAFYNCTGLTSIEIPEAVTSVGSQAFSGCTGIESVYISDLAAWCRIDFESVSSNPLDSNRNLYLNGEKTTDLVIPDGVTEIKAFAFANCTKLTSIKLPQTLERIADAAFMNCVGLTEIEIPSRVNSIDYAAFYGCTRLTAVYISDLAAWCGINFASSNSNPLECGGYLYLNGEKVTDAVIPEGVTAIKDYTFAGSAGLASISFPQTLEHVGKDSFIGTGWYNNHPNGVVYAGNVLYKYKGVMPADTRVVVKEGTVTISESAFGHCTNLVGIDIPGSVTTIGAKAFMDCTGLTSIEIPGNVTRVEDMTFYGCSNLADIELHDNIAYIGEYAFSRTAWYENRPDGALYIGKVLYGYIGTIPEDSDVVIEDGTLAISSNAFYYRELTGVVIPNSVKYIGNNAFSYSALKRVTMGSGITSIGNEAFAECYYLGEVHISDIEAWRKISYADDDYPFTYADLYVNGVLVEKGAVRSYEEYE